NPQWSLGISVSRRILFHSATLLGTALYLLAMSAAGYYLRFFGGSWGAVMQVTFLFGAVALLVGILFSGVFRSWLKVFISKHFYNYNYDYREEWLGFTRTLSEHGHGLGERTIQAVAALVESPGGALFICRDSGNCEPVDHWNMNLPHESESASGSLCQFLESKQWVIDLQEYDSNPEKYGAIFIPQWLREVSKGWLIVPLILLGRLFGFMILTQPRSKVKLNWEVIDLLKIAGSQAASYLSQQESANALMVARQFESFNRMSTFIVHDLKNLVSQLSLLLSNAEKHKNNPEFQKDMLDTLDYSVQKMKLLLHKLSRGSSIEYPAPLLIDKLLRQTLALRSAFEPKPELEVLDPDLMVVANWDRLERVIGHIIQNAVEATPKDGKVTIRISKLEAFVVVEIRDTGQGMSEEFIHERLFKPFESTKSAGMGIGMFESREYIHELGGRIKVSSRQAAGTTFQVLLPFHEHVDDIRDAALRQE
ncbi:MAG: XrtA/PEP-CTERM system histidine kinase PrsK, partial [Candidatus Nitrotoga sp.]